jgi:hypothetical protein
MKGVRELEIRQRAGGAVLAVKAVPGSSRDRLAGVLGEALKVTTAAAAEKGRANQAILRLLARAVGVDRRSVTLLSGHTAARKEVLFEGLSAEDLRSALERA